MKARALRRFVVFGFATTHDALAAEHALRQQGVEVVPIPTPASLGAFCGIALRVPHRLEEEARATLVAALLPPASEALIEDV